MRVIVWGINYAPELTGIAPFNTGLCDHLLSRGHQVEMVTTFPYYPYWQKIPGDRGVLYRTDDFDGMLVHRCWHYVPRAVTTIRRIWHELSFGLTSLVRTLFLARADVYLIVSPPLLLGPMAAFVCWLKQRPFIFHVQDLQPDAAVGLGMVKPGRFTRLLYRVEAFSYRRAAAVSGISGAMLDAYERKGVPAAKRLLFPNWIRWYGRNTGVREDADRRAARGREFRRKYGIPEDTFLATYSGNLGKKQGLETLIAAAAMLRADPGGPTAEGGAPRTQDGFRELQIARDRTVGVAGIPGFRNSGIPTGRSARRAVLILIVGDGAMRRELEHRIAELGAPNVRMMSLLLEVDYHGMLAASDVGLILQAPGTGQFFLPSKLLSVLSLRVPVLCTADDDSELARAVREGGFGENLPAGNAEALAHALAELAGDPEKLARLAQQTNWVDRFSGERVLTEFERELVRVASARSV